MSYQGANEKELCPNLTTSDDLVNKLGVQVVDLINKDKVISELWTKIDEVQKSTEPLEKKIRTLEDNLARSSAEKEEIKKTSNKKMAEYRAEFNNTLNKKNTELALEKEQVKVLKLELAKSKEVKPKRVYKKKKKANSGASA